MEIERVPYSPIVTRPKLTLPGGKRIAVYVVPNIEFYEYLPPPSPLRDPWPRTPHPDVLGYGVRDYGNRVGLWRMFEVMDKFNVRGTVSLNVALLDHFPDILEACERRKWDFLGHGLYNTRYFHGISESEERDVIAACVGTYRNYTGRQLQGWLSPAITFTSNTPDLMAEAGISYYCDWVHDDQPFPIRVRKGRLITMPYAMDTNDAVMWRTGHEGPEFARMTKDQFDTLYREGAESARFMCIPLHPYIMGQPHRIKYVEDVLDHITRHDGVWMATGSEVAEWYYKNAYTSMATHAGMEN